MGDLLDYLPIAAAAFAIPQFLPQLRKLRASDDTAGVSWPWAALTSVNNAAWLVYFALSAYWAALVPASSATLLAGALAAMLARRGQARARPAVLIGAWVALLAAALAVAGRAGLGILLTAAFVVQVTPSIWTAYRTARPTGISRGTWLLILGELSCWTIFGVHKSDPRLMILGLTGVTASLLMLARIRRTTEIQPSPAPGAPADPGSSTAASRSPVVETITLPTPYSPSHLRQVNACRHGSSPSSSGFDRGGSSMPVAMPWPRTGRRGLKAGLSGDDVADALGRAVLRVQGGGPLGQLPELAAGDHFQGDDVLQAQELVLEADEVIAATGFRPDHAIAAELRLALHSPHHAVG